MLTMQRKIKEASHTLKALQTGTKNIINRAKKHRKQQKIIQLKLYQKTSLT